MAGGRFITVEGVEGAGKSTLMGAIRERLAAAGKPVLETREPGGTPLGEELRALLLEPRDAPMGSDAELLLMFAARAEHLEKVIRPALARGQWVVCDRFTDATYAYQGGGRGIPDDRIRVLEDWVQGPLRPHLTLILDVPVAVGFERIAARSGKDRFEREAGEFFERVRAAYHARAAADPGRCRLVDTSGTLDQARANLDRALQGFLA